MPLDAEAFSLTEILLRLGAATAAGLLLGFEREYHGKDAGIRTHALVSLSSALITTSASVSIRRSSLTAAMPIPCA